MPTPAQAANAAPMPIHELRAEVEDAIQRLIDLLDALDGDADLEDQDDGSDGDELDSQLNYEDSFSGALAYDGSGHRLARNALRMHALRTGRASA